MEFQNDEIVEKPVSEVLYSRQASVEIKLSPVHLSLENSSSDSSDDEKNGDFSETPKCATKVVEYTLKKSAILQEIPRTNHEQEISPVTRTPPSSRRCSTKITEKNPNFQIDLQQKLQNMLLNKNQNMPALLRNNINSINEKCEQIAINIDPIVPKLTPMHISNIRRTNQTNHNDTKTYLTHQKNKQMLIPHQITDVQIRHTKNAKKIKSSKKISPETIGSPSKMTDKHMISVTSDQKQSNADITEPSDERNAQISNPIIRAQMIDTLKEKQLSFKMTEPSNQMNAQITDALVQKQTANTAQTIELPKPKKYIKMSLSNQMDAKTTNNKPSNQMNAQMTDTSNKTQCPNVEWPSKIMDDKRNFQEVQPLNYINDQVSDTSNQINSRVMNMSNQKRAQMSGCYSKIIDAQSIEPSKQMNTQTIEPSEHLMNIQTKASKQKCVVRRSETVNDSPSRICELVDSKIIIRTDSIVATEQVCLEKKYDDKRVLKMMVEKEVALGIGSLGHAQSSTGNIKALIIPKTEIPLEHDVSRVGGPKTDTEINMASLRPKSPASRPIVSKNEKDESIWDKLGTLGRKKRIKEVQEVQAEGKYAIDSPGLPAAPVIPPEEYNLEDNEERCIIDPKAWEDPKFQDLMNVLKEWINDELASQRIIVQDLTEDLYDGQVLQKLLEKLTGDKLDVPEVTQSEEGQKQKLAVVLAHFNQVLGVQRLSHNKWSVETIHSKNIVAIIHLLVSLARHFRPPVRLTENVSVDVVVVRKHGGQLMHKIVRESLTKAYDDVGMRCERDAFDTLFDHAPDKLQVVKKSLVTFVNKHLNKMNFEVSEIETQFHDGVYLIMLMGLLEGFFVPHYVFHLTPHEFEQKVHNVSFAFELMEEVGLQKPKARPEDVVNMDLKSTLRVLYNLFLRYKTII